MGGWGGLQLSLATEAVETTWAVKTALGPDLGLLLLKPADLGSNTSVTFSPASSIKTEQKILPKRAVWWVTKMTMQLVECFPQHTLSLKTGDSLHLERLCLYLFPQRRLVFKEYDNSGT